ncbi:MAG: rhomboid family intramembrane serine protease, partial [Synechococcaceae cyanobacterium]|nr:rhomboid family intramembrane serine protease [Synechococcaceae cyanobacterium]
AEKAQALSPAARKALGRARHEAVKDTLPPGGDFGSEPVPWRRWFWGFFIEAESDAVPGTEPRAVATLGLAMLMTLVSLLVVATDSLAEFGLASVAPWRHGGSTLLAHAFAALPLEAHGHALAHLLVQLYMFWLVARPLEHRVGAVRLSALFLCGTLAGGLAFALFEPRPDVMLVGPAAGMSAVVTAFALRFPRARTYWLLELGRVYRWARVPAIALLVLWLPLEAQLDVMAWNGVIVGSLLAALGGAAVAVAFLIADRPRGPAARDRSA